MSIHSIANPANIPAALLAAVIFGLSPPAWSADVEDQRQETDGHDHVMHQKEHDLGAKSKVASPTAIAAKGDPKFGEAFHQAEETDGHDHAAHKKGHNLSR